MSQKSSRYSALLPTFVLSSFSKDSLCTELLVVGSNNVGSPGIYLLPVYLIVITCTRYEYVFNYPQYSELSIELRDGDLARKVLALN